MTVINKKEPILLAVGDLVILAVSLLLTLILRYGEIPSQDFVRVHAVPFSIIFAFTILIFYISGLYSRMISIARNSVPSTLIRSQMVSGIIAALLFYMVPVFEVTPKTTLFIYLALSVSFLILWRISAYPILWRQRRAPTLVIGHGLETEEIKKEMSISSRLGLYCALHISPQSSLENFSTILDENRIEFQYIVTDMNNERLETFLPELYRRYFPTSRIIDLHDLYENIFNRIPLSCMNYAWIMSNVSSISPKMYDIMKRFVDIVLGLMVGVVACIAYPFISLAIKIDDGGPIFISQERIGRNNGLFKIHKFRTMQKSDRGVWLTQSENKVTRVGYFLRKSRLDELPQALAILRGDMSIIGPRADIIDLGKKLEHEIPYYSIRTVIQPGLTGWAQINQEKPPQSVEETKVRLSYDLYYIKHRSFGLDIRIALRTLKTLLSREGM